MKTIKIIDLFIKIANGEEVPKKIKYRDVIYNYDKEDYFGGDAEEYYNDALLLPHVVNVYKFLNEEVEIIEDTPKEDKKIAKVGRKAKNITNQYLKEKLNEIINKINGE